MTLLPGDGLGPQLVESVKDIFQHLNVPVQFEEVSLSSSMDAKQAEQAYAAVLDSLKRNKVGLKGVLFTPPGMRSKQSVNLKIRKDLDLFTHMALVKNLPDYASRHKDVDFVVIRENLEGEYSGLEHEAYPGVVESFKVITREKTERVAKFAFDYALMNGRKKVTVVHKGATSQQLA